jgi:uncharacterized protein YbaA (DUF1428 family)
MTYIDGFLAPVSAGRREDYVKMAEEASQIFLDHGALQVVETYGDDVPAGKLTDMWKAVAGDKEAGEGLIFSWIVWPSKEARDEGWKNCMADERMKARGDNPMDGKRMIYGGFQTVLDTGSPK